MNNDAARILKLEAENVNLAKRSAALWDRLGALEAEIVARHAEEIAALAANLKAASIGATLARKERDALREHVAALWETSKDADALAARLGVLEKRVAGLGRQLAELEQPLVIPTVKSEWVRGSGPLDAFQCTCGAGDAAMSEHAETCPRYCPF